MIKVHVPGKLYISGEYAVLAPKQPAILVAVDQFLSLELSEAKEIELHSPDLGLEPLVITSGDVRASLIQDSPWKYVLNAIAVFSEWSAIGDVNYNYTYRTELIHKSGAKLGLGSSGAVVVATLKGLSEANPDLILTQGQLFKLAAIALTRSGSSGSMGDIAASVYGGWVYYQALDREWLQRMLADQISVSELLDMDWPWLEIQSLEVHESIDLRFVWTGRPASTDSLVQILQEHLHFDDGLIYEAFLIKAGRSVLALANALTSGEISQAQTELDNYYQLLVTLSETYQIPYLTDELERSIRISQDHGYASKPSGAGGGDCGIAIGSCNVQDGASLEASWQAAGLLPLNFQVHYNRGVDSDDQ